MSSAGGNTYEGSGLGGPGPLGKSLEAGKGRDVR